MIRVRKRVLVTGVLLVTLAGCGSSTPVPTVTPKLNADGSYRVGTVGNADAIAAVKAATKALPIALSYDYRSLDASLARATALMTPAFATKFRTTFDATTRTMATQKQAITSALVRGAGIIGTIQNGRATVLVFLDQVLVSSKDKKASDPLDVSQNRVHVSLVKQAGRWRVSDIEPF
ncbi:MAG: hypothetical protein JWQ32_942 [Marmoricola sp.]|nr:hypothetical protein [Marmoricola sp.]